MARHSTYRHVPRSSFELAFLRAADLSRPRMDGWAVRLEDGTLHKPTFGGWGLAQSFAKRVGGTVVLWTAGPRADEPSSPYPMASGV